METFDKAYAAATKVLPNNNILNIISKAKQALYQEVVLEFFKVDRKVPFTFDDPQLSYLYTNGVIDYEVTADNNYYVRFASPFVQKRLFNYFAHDLFRHLGGLHFNLYMYLSRFLESYGGRVTPEFPTGNGKLDLLVQYTGQRYGLEVKSFSEQTEYQRSLRQAAEYGRQLGLTTITLLLFIETVDDQNRQKFEVPYQAQATGVLVTPIFVATG